MRPSQVSVNPALANRRGTDALSPVRRRMLLFLGVFTVILLMGFALLEAPFAQPAVNLFSRSLVQAAARLILLFGGHATVSGDVLASPANSFAVQMKNGCNGVHVMILLWAAIVAFPASSRHKLKGLVVGTLAIQGVNLIRFISLYYLGQFDRGWFDFAHLYLWESLIVLDAMVIFWWWVQRAFRGAVKPGAVH